MGSFKPKALTPIQEEGEKNRSKYILIHPIQPKKQKEKNTHSG